MQILARIKYVDYKRQQNFYIEDLFKRLYEDCEMTFFNEGREKNKQNW